MLKFAVAGAVLVLGLTAPVAAAPRDDDMRRLPRRAATTAPRSSRKSATPAARAPTKLRSTFGRRSAETQARPPFAHRRLRRLPPRRKYDSQEVVKKVRNIDHSRVINTGTVVPARTARPGNQSPGDPARTRPATSAWSSTTTSSSKKKSATSGASRSRPRSNSSPTTTASWSGRPPSRSRCGRAGDYECGRGDLVGYHGSCRPSLRVRG